MIIRKATAADAAVIAEYNTRLAFETEAKRLDLATVERGVLAVVSDLSKGWYLLADRDGDVVGQLSVTFEWSDWQNGWFWWIQSVYVRQDARGQGIYHKLHNAVVERATAAGDVVAIRLYVEKDNARGQSTYSSVGMKPTSYLVFEQLLYRNQE